MLNKTIICPKFPKNIIDQKLDIVYPYTELCNYISNQNDLNFLFETKNKPKVDSNLKREFIERKIFKNDGKSSSRVENSIIKLIKKQ